MVLTTWCLYAILFKGNAKPHCKRENWDRSSFWNSNSPIFCALSEIIQVFDALSHLKGDLQVGLICTEAYKEQECNASLSAGPNTQRWWTHDHFRAVQRVWKPLEGKNPFTLLQDHQTLGDMRNLAYWWLKTANAFLWLWLHCFFFLLQYSHMMAVFTRYTHELQVNLLYWLHKLWGNNPFNVDYVFKKCMINHFWSRSSCKML